MMKRILAVTCILFAAASAVQAENLIMKDGRVIPAKSLRRQGDSIMATVEIPAVQPGDKPQTGELGYPIAQISRIDFPEPPQLHTAADLISQGKYPEALAQLDPVMRYYQSFRDAPGSWWADTLLLQIQAFVGEGREKEAEPMVDDLGRLASDPEIKRAARAFSAAAVLRRGHPKEALEICQTLLKESNRPSTLAQASVTAGGCHLQLKEYDDAITAFLQIPVFFPEEKTLIAASLLGSGIGYEAIQDFPRAKLALNTLVTSYGATTEARRAKTELEKIAKAETIPAQK